MLFIASTSPIPALNRFMAHYPVHNALALVIDPSLRQQDGRRQYGQHEAAADSHKDHLTN